MTQFFNVTGVKRLDLRLSRMQTSVAKKAVKKGVGKGLLVMKSEIKKNARAMGSGGKGGGGLNMGALIANATKLHTPKKQKSGMYVRGVSQKNFWPFVHETKAGKRYWIPYAIQYGHAFPGGGGSKSKDVKAVPFITKAYYSKRRKTVDVFNQVIHNAIEAT